MITRLGKAFAVLLLLIPLFAGIRIVYGETDVGAKLITNVSIVNSHNEVITSIEKDDSFKIDMTWSLENLGDLKAGDKATVTLPVEIEGVNNTYALYDENNNLVVNVTQVGNQLTFVFTEFVEQNTNVHGDFYFWTKFSDEVTENQINNINFETVNGTQSVPIFIQAVDDTGEGALLTKQGLYLGTQEPKRIIDWRVYINSFDTNQVTIKDGTFIDILGPHQTLISTTARVVYGPSVSNPTYVEQVPIVLNSDGSFEIPLRDTEERIYITYKTETDGSLEQYTNRGILDAVVNDVPRTSSITGYTPRYGGGGGGTGEPGESSSTEPSSGSSTSSTTEPSSESSTSSSTESSSESSTSSSTEPSSGSSTSSTTEPSSESSTSSSTEPNSESSTSSSTEPSSESSTSSTTEPSSESSTTSSTEPSSESSTSSNTEPSSESSTSSSTEPSSESITSNSTEPSSDSSTSESTESTNRSSSSNTGAVSPENSSSGINKSSKTNNLHNQSEKQHFPQTNEVSNHLWIAIGMVLTGCALKLGWSKFIR
ncbi:collagen binding domain protein [Enterococcus sp. C1]|uniref:Ig-like domain-containing protein n=1 Tax=Enterococcus TaxID=1350 RepID=UPI000271DC6A|nr:MULTISPECIES: Ig-like domain-containing protein [Enterococcus]EJF50007.1 collagen binding domain protein [Enterococcus sp. C1]WEI93691.1 Ig-like domain-containing protein [Enterococcus casseliflavus]